MKLKLMKMIIVVATLLMIFATESLAKSAWNLVYENDQYGNQTYGNISDLEYAVQNGKDIKVMLHSIPTGNVNFTSPKTYVDTVNHNVIAQFSELSSDTNDFSDNTIYHRFWSFNTNGDSILKYLEDPNKNVILHYALSWYVRD